MDDTRVRGLGLTARQDFLIITKRREGPRPRGPLFSPLAFTALILSSSLIVPIQSACAEGELSAEPALEQPAAQPAHDQEDLNKLSIAELREKAKAIEAGIPEIAKEAQELAGQLRELRIAAQQNEAVLAVRAEMAELQRKLEKVIDELPDVKAKAEEVAKAKTKLFEEMQLRTRVFGLIAAAEKKAALEGDAKALEGQE